MKKNFTLLSVALAMAALSANATIYEAELATKTAAAIIKTDVASASGGSYVDTQNGGSLTFSISIPTAGWYNVTAATKSPDSRSEYFKIDADPAFKVAIPANATANFAEIAVGGKSQYFTAGAHTIVTSKDWGYLPIDYIKVEATNNQVYQAEKVTLTGDNVVYTAAGSVSEGRYLDSKGSNVTFNLMVPVTGNYKVSIVGKGADVEAPGNVRVNDFQIDANPAVSLEMTGPTYVERVISESILLTAGAHTVLMTKSWGYVGLDYLKVDYLSTPTNVTSTVVNAISVTSNSQQITINSSSDKAYAVSVYDVTGVLKFENSKVQGSVSINDITKTGLYIVVVGTSTGTETYKVMLK